MIKHFCVSVYVFNPKSKNFLMVNHKKLGKWVQPGGHIELNEDPEEASLREVFEETGIKVKLIGKRYPREEDYITPIAIQKNIVKENHIHIINILCCNYINSKCAKCYKNYTGWRKQWL